MKKILFSLIVLISLAAQGQKPHYGNYRFDSLYSTLSQMGLDTTNFKIVVQRVSDGKHFKMYWPTFGGSGTTTNALTFNNSGSGDASGSTFNGSAAKTLSYNSIGAQPTLVSGTNIKTVNGSSILGSGDLTISTTKDLTVLKHYYTQTASTGSGTTDNVTIVNIPANTLSNNGDVLEIEVAYTTTGSDTKSVDVKIGGSSTFIGSSSATTAAAYSQKIKMMRTNSTSAIVRTESIRDNSAFAIYQLLNTSFDWTTSQDLKVTLTSTTAGSIVINYVTVKFFRDNTTP